VTRHKARPKRQYPKPPPAPKPRPARGGLEDLVTDHALVRYLQRVVGMNIDDLRRQLVSDGRATVIRQIECGRLRLSDGLVLVVKGGKVVTVLAGDD